MFPAKSVLTIFLSVFVFSACNFWRGDVSKPLETSSVGETKSTVPFETKEPEVYQCEIVETNILNGERSERIVKIARNGEKVRYDFPNGGTFLQLSESEKYLIQNKAGIYVQTLNGNGSPSESGETLSDFLTSKWLNERSDAKFENLGTKDNLTEFRVVLDESIVSEFHIFVDESLKLPVKQEYYSISGEAKTLVSVMELRNFAVEVEESRFKLPAGIKKVSIDEYQKALQFGRN